MSKNFIGNRSVMSLVNNKYTKYALVNKQLNMDNVNYY